MNRRQLSTTNFTLLVVATVVLALSTIPRWHALADIPAADQRPAAKPAPAEMPVLHLTNGDYATGNLAAVHRQVCHVNIVKVGDRLRLAGGGLARADVRRTARVAVVEHVDVKGPADIFHRDVRIPDVVNFAAVSAIAFDSQAVVSPAEAAAADDHVAQAIARRTADRDAVAMQAGEVFHQYIARAAVQRDVVIARVDLALADDDALAGGVDRIGIGRVTGRDDANIFDRHILAAGHQMKHRRVGERDAIDVQPRNS